MNFFIGIFEDPNGDIRIKNDFRFVGVAFLLLVPYLVLVGRSDPEPSYWFPLTFFFLGLFVAVKTETIISGSGDTLTHVTWRAFFFARRRKIPIEEIKGITAKSCKGKLPLKDAREVYLHLKKGGQMSLGEFPKSVADWGVNKCRARLGFPVEEQVSGPEPEKPLLLSSLTEVRSDPKDAIKRCSLFTIVGGTVIAMVLAVGGVTFAGVSHGAGFDQLLAASQLPLTIATVEASPQSIWVVSILGVAEEVRLLGNKVSHFYFPLHYLAFLIFLFKSFVKGILGYVRGDSRMAGTGMNDVAVGFLLFGLSWILVGPIILYFATG